MESASLFRGWVRVYQEVCYLDEADAFNPPKIIESFLSRPVCALPFSSVLPLRTLLFSLVLPLYSLPLFPILRLSAFLFLLGIPP